MVESQIMESVAGLRGYGPEFIERLKKFIGAYSKFYFSKGFDTIVLGKDTRFGEKEIIEVAKRIFLENGYSVVDVGIVPTPTVQLIAKDFGVLGCEGTASHNPDPWLGFKPFIPEGIISAEDLANIQEISKGDIVSGDKLPGLRGGVLPIEEAEGREIDFEELVKDEVPSITGEKVLDYHISRVLKEFDDSTIEKIKENKYRVVIDHVLGAGYKIVPALLRHLGCEVVEVYSGEPGEKFPREFPEPTPNNLGEFTNLLLGENVDVGFAIDPDADRLVLGLEGKCLSEEYTLAVAIDYITRKFSSGSLVANLSTSRMGEDVAKKRGFDFFRTSVGERNVMNGIVKNDALIGGEGSGGIINPKVAPGRDSIYGIVLVLAHMAESSKGLKFIVEELPKYFMVKEKIPLGNVDNFDEILKKVENLELKSLGNVVDKTEIDGLKVNFENGWVHLRKSITEPILRVIAEADSQENVDNLVEKVKGLF